MAAPVGRGDGVSSPSSMAPSTRVGQLVPAGREQLDAVVRHGVVRGGDHHAEVGTELARRGRRRPGWAARRPGPRRRRPTRAPRPRRPRASRRWPAGPVRPRATGRCDRSRSASTRAADADSRTASSGVRSSPLARPRTPSVPNKRRCDKENPGQRLLYWGALRAFLRPYFLRSMTRGSRVRKPAFFSGGRSSESASIEGPGDGQAQRAGLTGRAATLQVGEDVEALGLLHGDQRLADQLLVQLVREVLLEALAVEP